MKPAADIMQSNGNRHQEVSYVFCTK